MVFDQSKVIVDTIARPIRRTGGSKIVYICQKYFLAPKDS
jgi:hypothetical protein